MGRKMQDWHVGVDAKGMKKLTTISTEIGKIVEDTTLTVARARLRIGNLLLDARRIFPGDRQFGQWRKATLDHIAPRTANTYMHMAGTFKNAPDLIEAVGWSKARDFLSVDGDAKAEVTKKIEAGEAKPAELIEVVDEASGEKIADIPTVGKKAGRSKDAKSGPVVSMTGAQHFAHIVDNIIDSPMQVRHEAIEDGELEMIDEVSRAHVFLGFVPGSFDEAPNQATWSALIQALISTYPDMERSILGAESVISSAWATRED